MKSTIEWKLFPKEKPELPPGNYVAKVFITVNEYGTVMPLYYQRLTNRGREKYVWKQMDMMPHKTSKIIMFAEMPKVPAGFDELMKGGKNLN